MMDALGGGSFPTLCSACYEMDASYVQYCREDVYQQIAAAFLARKRCSFAVLSAMPIDLCLLAIWGFFALILLVSAGLKSST